MPDEPTASRIGSPPLPGKPSNKMAPCSGDQESTPTGLFGTNNSELDLTQFLVAANVQRSRSPLLARLSESPIGKPCGIPNLINSQGIISPTLNGMDTEQLTKDLIVQELKTAVKFSPIRDEFTHMKEIAKRFFWLSMGFIIGFLTAIGGLFIYALPKVIGQ